MPYPPKCWNSVPNQETLSQKNVMIGKLAKFWRVGMSEIFGRHSCVCVYSVPSGCNRPGFLRLSSFYFGSQIGFPKYDQRSNNRVWSENEFCIQPRTFSTLLKTKKKISPILNNFFWRFVLDDNLLTRVCWHVHRLIMKEYCWSCEILHVIMSTVLFISK